MQILKQCTTSLFGKIAIGGLIIAAGLILWGVTPGLIMGAAPILLMAACLLPCLIPLVFLRDRRSREAPGQQPGAEQESRS